MAESTYNAARLPYDLKDEFRKRQDPALDEAIRKAESDTFGAAIKGLDMYQNISNPFTRRRLAEQYQGGIEQGWKNLTDERTRRQGVYADYIEKWTGLFGAEAAKERDIFNNKLATFDRYNTLAQQEESKRRWEIENARAERGSGSGKDYTEQEIRSTINKLKNEGKDWETIANFLGENGVDVNHKSVADEELNRAFTPNFSGYEKDKTATEQLNEFKLQDEIRDREIRQKADTGAEDFYWAGTTVKKRKRGIFGLDWTAADETIKSFD